MKGKALILMALALPAWGCSQYGSASQAECQSLADCNPGKTCGELVRCVNGKCDPELVTELPCQQGCMQDPDCPDGMHCRLAPNDANECVLDGTCQDVSECEDLAHDDCRGGFECQDGTCVYVCDDMTACQVDSDCVKVPADCCGCEMGGGEKAINTDSRQAYLDNLNDVCAVIDIACQQFDACTEWPAVCDDGHCKTLREKCGCSDGWDPVCSEGGGVWATFGSSCEAECVGVSWGYHGRCECEMDYGGMCTGTVCAANGTSYQYGESEAICNGQQVAYPGPCSPDCQTCSMLGRPSIPACDQDFCDVDDVCYAECQDREWWHQGQCLPGEGDTCGGIAGQGCSTDDLFCLIKDDYPDAAGVCIVLGHCLQASDCEHQPLDHIECVGSWACQEHACDYLCAGD